MLKSCVVLFAVSTIGLVASAAAEPASTIVTIDAGAIEGTRSQDGQTLAFKGIPYARPPMGDLRWRPPQPVRHFKDMPIGKDYGSDCLQMVTDTEAMGSEDCLFLNVWRPADKTSPDERLPVMVWIHGGGLVMGGSSDKNLKGIYDGSALARQGLVVVSLNYRLGRLGFFAHPALIMAAHRGAMNYSGNFGLMDQIAALEWVQTFIAKFGGDNRQVTVAGESAGGISVMHLLTSPFTTGKDLFQRAIVMSGAGRRTVLLRQMMGGNADKPSADMIGETFAKSVGIEGSGPDAVAKLLALKPMKDGTKEATQLLSDLTFNSLVTKQWLDDPHSSMVMIDNVFVAGEPETALCHGEAMTMPLIIGTVALELPLFFPPKKEPYPYAYFADQEAARKTYTDVPLFAIPLVGMDMTMHEPARFVAKAMTAASNKAWLYRFTYVVDSADPLAQLIGTPHSAEIPFLFQTLDKQYDKDKITENDQKMASAFSSYFVNFAKSADANPNLGSLPPWPQFDSSFQLMHFRRPANPVEKVPKFEPEPRGGVRLVEQAARCP